MAVLRVRLTVQKDMPGQIKYGSGDVNGGGEMKPGAYIEMVDLGNDHTSYRDEKKFKEALGEWKKTNIVAAKRTGLKAEMVMTWINTQIGECVYVELGTGRWMCQDDEIVSVEG